MPSRAWPRSWGDSWRIIALDQRGHGYSDRPSDFSRTGCVEDAATVLKDLGIDGAVVLGHSPGIVQAYVVHPVPHLGEKPVQQFRRGVVLVVETEPQVGDPALEHHARDHHDRARRALASGSSMPDPAHPSLVPHPAPP